MTTKDEYALSWNGPDVIAASIQARRQGLIAGCLVVKEQAKNLCPVGKYPKRGKARKGHRTTKGSRGRVGGNLRSSIHHGVDAVGDMGFVGTNVHYAPYVELGTSKMSARPYLRPALQMKRDEVLRVMRAAFDAYVGKR